MHITVLTQYYPPEIGAPQKRLSEIVAHIIRSGHSVAVITAMPNYPTGKIHPGYGGIFRRELLEGADVFRTFIYPTQKAAFLPRLTNYFSFALSSAVLGSFKLRCTDYLLVESPPLFLGLTGIWLSRIKRAKMIFNVSDLWPESAVQLGVLRNSGMAYRVSVWLESLCYRNAWLITGQSKGIIDSIKRRFPDRRVYHLSNGVDTQRFPQALSNQDVSNAANQQEKFLVTYAGLHGLAQGLEQILESANVLRPDDNIVFHLIGDGPEKQKLVALARQQNLANVRFFAALSSDQIPRALSSSAVIIVPLKKDISGAVPSKLYEAMACGRPVILVAKGEAADIVREHQVGIVVPPGDTDGLVKAILTLYANKDLREKLGEKGRQAAVQHFDRSTIANRFIEYLTAQK